MIRRGLPKMEFLTPQALRCRRRCRWIGLGPLQSEEHPPVSFGAPPDDRMSITASEDELFLSGNDDSAVMLPSGVVALSEPDLEMAAAFPGHRECRARVESQKNL